MSDVNSTSPLYHNSWMSILLVVYFFHILLNLKTVIQSNIKFILFLTNFSVDFSLCVSELKKNLKN